ncbi:hypothetical protein LTR37_006618 [Vermiconidia calcicola]|uniref:Uncharacterized protein n=1 Tax=Vermiconidia calcicola TaxID=1690605 RepID=A0ACC3NFP5_9PEZI|nr:hypothetical protein LTR37_006618 [Vermiconidia calcicola]
MRMKNLQAVEEAHETCSARPRNKYDSPTPHRQPPTYGPSRPPKQWKPSAKSSGSQSRASSPPRAYPPVEQAPRHPLVSQSHIAVLSPPGLTISTRQTHASRAEMKSSALVEVFDDLHGALSAISRNPAVVIIHVPGLDLDVPRLEPLKLALDQYIRGGGRVEEDMSLLTQEAMTPDHGSPVAATNEDVKKGRVDSVIAISELHPEHAVT